MKILSGFLSAVSRIGFITAMLSLATFSRAAEKSALWDTSNWDIGDDVVWSDYDGFGESQKEGSPIKPSKVTLCHEGHTISVSQTSVPAHLAHGDTLGPCPTATTVYSIVCHEGQPIVVRLADIPGHLRHGDTLGYCTGEDAIIMCDGKENIVVKRAEAQGYLDKGCRLGPCQGQEGVIMCHKGEPIVVLKDRVEAHLKNGDTLGPCPKN